MAVQIITFSPRNAHWAPLFHKLQIRPILTPMIYSLLALCILLLTVYYLSIS